MPVISNVWYQPCFLIGLGGMFLVGNPALLREKWKTGLPDWVIRLLGGILAFLGAAGVIVIYWSRHDVVGLNL